ncbi:MAG: isochorismatase family protein, partial [Euryarchaeota archaeon]|nr:isochorismatase family protein [Euryarchaeota archaeon]
MSKKAMIIVDMIHDFVYGKFGSKQAQSIVPKIKELLKRARESG